MKRTIQTLLVTGLVTGVASAATYIEAIDVTLLGSNPTSGIYIQNPGNGTATSGDLMIDGTGLIDAATVATGQAVGSAASTTQHIAGYNNGRVSRVRNANAGSDSDFAATLDFDLGGTFNLGGIALWNNSEDGGNSNRGWENTTISVSTDGGANFTPTGITLTWTEITNAANLAGNQGATEPVTGWVLDGGPQIQYLGSTISGVTDVRLDVDNFNGANNIIQVMEVRFIDGVPEPSTALLGALGLLGLLRRRR